MALLKKKSHNGSKLSGLEMDESAYVLYHKFETGTKFICNFR